MTIVPPSVPTPVIAPMVAIRLVLGVARLGEADLNAWWSSQGLNPSVSFALAGFRRTGAVVGAELALLSATRRHDQLLPRRNAVHMFSPHLPFVGWAGAYLAELKSNCTRKLLEELSGWTNLKVAAAALEVWRDDLGHSDAAPSTVTTADLADPPVAIALLARFVDAYLAASGELSVPYVDLAS